MLIGGDARTSSAHSFEEVFKTSYPRLVSQLLVVTSNPADAEEVVQEAFARLWQRWRRVREFENVESWIRRVALNEAISRYRRQARRGFGRNTQHAAVPEIAAPDANTAILGTSVLKALRGIPVQQRSALFYRYVMDLSIDDIAKEMCTKPGTVKSWLSRGRALLQQELDGGAAYDA